MDETTVGFEVFEIPSEPIVESKPRKARTQKPKRGPGRPRVYSDAKRRVVANALRKFGLTKGLEKLASRKTPLKVSLTLARAVAAQEGIAFQRGRPVVKRKKAA